MTSNERVAGSFRDPSGFLYRQDGILYRQVHPTYREHYDCLMNSGLYDSLVDSNYLIPHQEVETSSSESVYKVLQPEEVPFISYPYEWCFGQLRDASLRTLQIQKRAIEHGMILKDASAYNIQFHHGRPVLIDTLSFEVYEEGEPWVAYGQFCRHFLAPLAIMALTDIRLNQLLLANIDGIPLDLASRLLPWKSRLRFGLLLHVHLHAKSQTHFSDKPEAGQAKRKAMSKNSLLGLIDSLEGTLRRLVWKGGNTEWGEYYDATNYSSEAFESKKRTVGKFIETVNPESVWDLGANTGEFSRLSSDRGIQTVAFDLDPVAVEKDYQRVKKEKEDNLLPHLLDLRNPSPSIGWGNRERDSLIDRGPVDLVLALALIHHLAITNNVPLESTAHFFKRLCSWLIIEFVPKSDSQVQRLLATRVDIFPDYSSEGFERAFTIDFEIVRKETIPDSERNLYLMKRR